MTDIACGIWWSDYTSAAQAAQRDFVPSMLEAFPCRRPAGGPLLSAGRFCRVPAYLEGPDINPAGWRAFREYVHGQVRELLTNYGKIDVIWFDGLAAHARGLAHWRNWWRMDARVAAGNLINNRLGKPAVKPAGPDHYKNMLEDAGHSRELGDFGTPEHSITADPGRLWESCQVSTWRLWGYTIGEHWRPAELLLDMLVDAAGQGGNLLLNVGPDADGVMPPEFVERARVIGDWLRVNGEAVYGTEARELPDTVTLGRLSCRGNNLYLILRFWDRRLSLRLPWLQTRVRRAALLGSDCPLSVSQNDWELTISGLPPQMERMLFPVIRLECDAPPAVHPSVGKSPLWSDHPLCYVPWARRRGESVWADGQGR